MATNDSSGSDDRKPQSIFEEVFIREYQDLRRCARKGGLSDWDADDAMQEVAIKLKDIQLEGEISETRAKTYLCRMIYHTAMDIHRKRKRHGSIMGPNQQVLLAAPQDGQCDRFQSAAFYHRLLRESVRLLSEPHREIIGVYWSYGASSEKVIDELVRRAGEDPTSKSARQNQRTRLSQAHSRLSMISVLVQIRRGDSQHLEALIESLESGDVVHADVTHGLPRVSSLPPESKKRLQSVVNMLKWVHQTFSTETDAAKCDRAELEAALSDLPRAYDLLEWKNKKSRVRTTLTVCEQFSTIEGLTQEQVRSLFRRSHQKVLHLRDWIIA
jgi:DNA-directed RNA polymerase specialized sigma24 family protein